MSTQPTKPTLGEVVSSFTRAEQVTAAGCAVVIVSVFLTWKAFPAGIPGGDVNGLHSFGFLTLLIALVTSVYFVARSPFFRNLITTPTLPVTDAVAYVIAGVAEVVTVLLFSSHYGQGRTTQFGFYLALIGAALTAGGGFLALRDRGSQPPPKPGEEPGDGTDGTLGGPPTAH